MNRCSLLIALLLLLTACEGSALRNAELADSPEAYEAFLQKYPDSVEAETLRLRVEELRFLRAKREKKSEALRDYLTHHPDGANVEEARKLEDELSYYEASMSATPQAYQAYLDSHPDGAFVDDARKANDRLLYVPKVGVGEIRSEQINMARDPKGPLNGWQLEADITNNGDRSLRVVEVAIAFLDGSGATLKTEKWWAVAPELGGFPTPPDMIPPLHPTQTRVLVWSTADAPEGWVPGRFGVEVTKLQLKD